MELQRHKKRVLANQLAWGEFIGASEDLQQIAEQARAEIDRGDDPELVRRRILSRCEKLQLAGPRSALPSLTRRVLRMPVRRFLHEIADAIASRTSAKRVGDWWKAFSDRLGWDQWLTDYIYNFAVTGDPGPMYDSFGGKVIRLDVGRPGDKTPLVVVVLTPASPVSSLLEEGRQMAREVFGETPRIADLDNPEFGARALRLFQTHGTDMAFAKELARAEMWMPESDSRYQAFLLDVAKAIRPSVKQARYRFMSHGYAAFPETYPDQP